MIEMEINQAAFDSINTQVGLAADIFSYGLLLMEVSGHKHSFDPFDDGGYMMQKICNGQFKKQHHEARMEFLLRRYTEGGKAVKPQVKLPRFGMSCRWDTMFEEMSRIDPSRRPTIQEMGKFRALFPVSP